MLTKSQKQSIRYNHNKWLSVKQISKKLEINYKLVDQVVLRYLKWKVYYNKKICTRCSNSYPHTEEYFHPTWYKKQDWTKTLNWTCRKCLSKIRKLRRANWEYWLEEAKWIIKKKVKRILKYYNYRANLSREQKDILNKRYNKISVQRRR